MTIRNRLAALSLALVPAALASPAAFAAKDPVYTGVFSNNAVQGYDVVAYFTDGLAIEGSNQFRTEYQGAIFRFASQEHLDMFLADPEAYAPQYGGYCAWAVAQGYTAKGNAENWAIVDGKLYLNYNDKVQSDWDQDRAGFISTANENWQTVLD